MDHFPMPLLSRRAALAGMSLVGTTLLGSGASGLPTPRGANFDPASPEDNLRRYVKLQYSLIKEQVHGYFGGLVYALEGDLPPRLIFAIDGYGQGWTDPQPDGSYRLAWKEIAFIKDPVTGAILDRWYNPMIQEEVEVSHIKNPAANATLRAREQQMDSSFLTSQVDKPPRNPDGTNDFILPWQTIGAYTSVWNDTVLAMKHTLDPKIWVRESSGERISIGEFFQLVARTDELFDEARNQVTYTGAWARIASWHPWMLMGQRPGKLFYRCTTQRLASADELPHAFLAALKARAPDYLIAPTEWGPRFSTWKNFLATRLPKPPTR
jgi:hypothetical protein